VQAGCSQQPFEQGSTEFYENFSWPETLELTWKVTIGTDIECGPFTSPPFTIQGGTVDYEYNVPDELRVFAGYTPPETPDTSNERIADSVERLQLFLMWTISFLLIAWTITSFAKKP